MLRAIKHVPLSEAPGTAFDRFVLDAQDRHLRRKLLVSEDGFEVMVDLPKPVYCEDGDHLELEDGRYVEVAAAEEELYEITAASPRMIAILAWQLGNRHLPAEIYFDRILIRRDPVIRDMLLGLHAEVKEVQDQFDPVQGAYGPQGHFSHAH